MHDDLTTRSRNLPHFTMAGSAYFVTWRLHQQQEPLIPAERDLMTSLLKHFHRDRYFLYGYVVMDDHVHVVVRPLADNQLGKILHGWKSYSANQLQRKHGRQGSVWQHENYDRIIRGETDLMEKLNYILANPVRRWPTAVEYKWMGWEVE